MSSADTINGIVEIIAGQPNAASQYFNNAIQASSDNILARFYLARLAVANGRNSEARELFEQILVIQKSYAPAYIGLAQLEQNQGDGEKALKWLKQAVALGKDDISPTLVLANYYIEKKDVNNAKAVLTASLEQYPENEYRDMLMARVIQFSGDNEATEKYYKQLLGKYPGSSQLYIEFSVFLSKINRPDQARSYLTQALRLNPESLRLQSALSLVKLQEGNVDQALEIAKKIQADDPASSVGFILAGDIYMSKSRYSEAKTNYTEALKRTPARKTLYKLYAVYNALGQKKDGQQLIKSWLKNHPEDRVAMFDFANILLAAKDWSGAIAQYHLVLKQSPDHIASLNNIALAYLHIDKAKALDFAKRAYEQNKTNAALQDTLGWVYFKSGDPDKALPLLKKAAAQTRHPSIQYHLANVYADKGEAAKARELLDGILKSDKHFEERKQAEKLFKRLS